MTILFVFFALPLATILLAIVLQKILKSPILVAITFFAIYLIVAFLAFSDNLAIAIIAAIIYSIIAFITAVIVQLFNILRHRLCNNKHNNCSCNNRSCGVNGSNSMQTIPENGSLLRISSTCQNGDSNDLLTINSNCNCNANNNDNNDINIANLVGSTDVCGCNNNTQNEVAVAANVIASNNNGVRTGCNRNCFR